VLENAVQTITMRAEGNGNGSTVYDFLKKEEYGVVPSYLKDIQADIAAEKEKLARIMNAEKEVEAKRQSQVRVIAETEKQELLAALKTKWEAINRGEKAEVTSARNKYKEFASKIELPAADGASSLSSVGGRFSAVSSSRTKGVNGESFLLQEGAKGIANYPHMRAAAGLLYVSGISSRRPDNTHVGATSRNDGSNAFDLDIRAQTAAVLDNITAILSQAGANLSHVVDMSVFLVDIPRDYKLMNEVYNQYFAEPSSAPTRTTVAVHQLPHPNLLVEIKVVAVDPRVAAK